MAGMNRRMAWVVLFTVFLAFSCSKQERLVLLTDEIDAVTAAEIFNSENRDYKVIVQYLPDLDRFLTSDRPEADMVIGHQLDTPAIRKKMVRISPSIYKDSLYGYLLIGKKSFRLIPLSFDLPVILFSKTNQPEFGNSHFIENQELRTLGIRFNKKGRSGMDRVGFLPLRYDLFVYLTAEYFGANFWVDGETLQNNDAALDEAISLLRDWSVSDNDQTGRQRGFLEKYGYIPDVRLLAESKILFSFSTLSEMFQLPEHERRPLDFRYYSHDRSFPVGNTVYFGIPAQSGKKKKARSFLVWLLQPETQKKILDFKQQKRMNRFGFFGGLSTNPTVNELVFGEIYPDLLGHIPDEKYLTEQRDCGDNWRSIKSQVVIPWLRKRVLEETDKTLDEYYSDWLFYTVSD